MKRNSSYDVALEELESCLASPATVEAGVEINELTHIIDSFLETLSQENRDKDNMVLCVMGRDTLYLQP